MQAEHVLDFHGDYPFAAAFYYVFQTVYNLEVTVFVNVGGSLK
jgi:hypothetical protein